MPRLALLLAAFLAAAPAAAGDAWDAIRPLAFGDRPIRSGEGVLSLSAPVRAADDRAVPLAAEVAFADGRRLRALTFVIDENPMPVSAVFALADPEPAFGARATMRLNGPTTVRAIAEDDAGRLYMAERFVKTSGLGACAAPPVTDPALAEATMGQMALGPADAGTGPAARLAALAAGEAADPRVRLEIRHPQLTGLQKDQITLLYIPANYVERIEVFEDGAPGLTVTGSISLSEDPEIVFPHEPETERLGVRVTDTDGGTWETTFPLGPS